MLTYRRCVVVIQVEACTIAGCSSSAPSQAFRTPPAPPEGIPTPHLYSVTPTSVLLSWGALGRPNGPLEGCVVIRSGLSTRRVRDLNVKPCFHPDLVPWLPPRWLIERRVAGTRQPSTVGQLSAAIAPLSYLDASSALSPWTGYQYRLVARAQAGDTAGKPGGGRMCTMTRPALAEAVWLTRWSGLTRNRKVAGSIPGSS